MSVCWGRVLVETGLLDLRRVMLSDQGHQCVACNVYFNQLLHYFSHDKMCTFGSISYGRQ
jgi:hypothetical protein